MIEKGYPLLRQAGKRLVQQGVRFHDLSRVFVQHRETFYFDNCCHFNHKGNEVLASAIATALVQSSEPPLADAAEPASDEEGRP